MDWEYVVLEDRAETAWQHNNLVTQGWAQWMLIPWNDKVGRVCIMRRPKDEPRVWTEAEVEAVAKNVLAHDKELFESILADAQTEADMQTAWNKDLLKRNEELQAAIDAVVNRGRDLGLRGDNCVSYAVRQHLYPLATIKEETNG